MNALSISQVWKIAACVGRIGVVMKLAIPQVFVAVSVMAAWSSALGLRFRRPLEGASVRLNFCCAERKSAGQVSRHPLPGHSTHTAMPCR